MTRKRLFGQRKLRLVAAAGGAFVVVIASACGGTTDRGSSDATAKSGSAGPTPAQMAKLSDFAARVSNQNGEPSPQDSTVVATTYRTINRLIGDEVTTDEDVFVITLHGHFTAYNAGNAGGGAFSPPTGTVLTLVVRQSDLEGIEAALNDSGPTLAQLKRLGTVRPLLVHRL